jgi:hypothetical protein
VRLSGPEPRSEAAATVLESHDDSGDTSSLSPASVGRARAPSHPHLGWRLGPPATPQQLDLSLSLTGRLTGVLVCESVTDLD